jgi:hypothetical protein
MWYERSELVVGIFKVQGVKKGLAFAVELARLWVFR